MRILIEGGGGFVGAHLTGALVRSGHDPVADPPADAVILLGLQRVRATLDTAHLAGARVVIYMSAWGAVTSLSPALAARAWAEQLVRSAGLPWVVLRPEALWGPGDVLTNELAQLLRRLPFVPSPSHSTLLSPIHVGDATIAMLQLLGRPDLWRQAWSLAGPETMDYAELARRIGEAIGMVGRPRRRLPAQIFRLGLALEERLDRRPRTTRALLDRLVARRAPEGAPDLAAPLGLHLRPLVAAALRYLAAGTHPDQQLDLRLGEGTL